MEMDFSLHFILLILLKFKKEDLSSVFDPLWLSAMLVCPTNKKELVPHLHRKESLA